MLIVPFNVCRRKTRFFLVPLKTGISPEKILFPGNSIIFATFPIPPLYPRFRGNRNSIKAFKSADSFIRQDRFYRHRLFELKLYTARSRLRGISICMHCTRECKKSVVEVKINRDEKFAKLGIDTKTKFEEIKDEMKLKRNKKI